MAMSVAARKPVKRRRLISIVGETVYNRYPVWIQNPNRALPKDDFWGGSGAGPLAPGRDRLHAQKVVYIIGG
eukprot:6038410-Prymnesium_polylepis.1